jgi:gamma-glutamyltranspeptidase/glutathione hydrolase
MKTTRRSAPRRAAARSSGSRSCSPRCTSSSKPKRGPRRGPVAREAIYAAYERFYRGDIAAEIVRANREHGGLFTTEDLADWQVHIEEPVTTRYRDIDVYKLTTWVQGPAMLQALNILEGFDLQAMGYNSARYIHTLYQAMNLAFADRDFYYGDPYMPPAEPVRGLLSKDYAAARRTEIDPARNNPTRGPATPTRSRAGKIPSARCWTPGRRSRRVLRPKDTTASSRQASQHTTRDSSPAPRRYRRPTPTAGSFPSPPPAAGYRRLSPAVPGIGLSQRMQSFVLDERLNPFNVVAPGKRPRATLTPSLALRDGVPIMAFSVQGGDTQDQNLLQFFLNVVEFGMNVQQAAEAHNITSYQMQSSFGAHQSEPGRLAVTRQIPPYTRDRLKAMGYDLEVVDRTYSPITAILIDPEQGTFQGGASDYGDDYGIAW